jgi:hypothetical protein
MEPFSHQAHYETERTAHLQDLRVWIRLCETDRIQQVAYLGRKLRLFEQLLSSIPFVTFFTLAPPELIPIKAVIPLLGRSGIHEQ